MLFSTVDFSVLKEGWSGLVGRLAVTLDEVGIPIETGANVVKVEKHKAHLADGRHVETDVIILHAGMVKRRNSFLICPKFRS